nr:non-functional pseudokinase ZED1-like [Coffea arabica]
MDKLRNVFPFYKRKDEKEESLSSHFCQNGSLLLKELIACFGGRYELPIRSFTAGELIRATNNFSEQVNHIALDDWKFFRGNLQDRPILVKFGEVGREFPRITEFVIREIVVNSQMGHPKNVSHLIGCCLEFELPAVVYAYAPGMESLTHSLSYPRNSKLLSWKSRIKIASDIANVLLYLHTAFPSPIIFRDLKLARVILDNSGVAKLVGFMVQSHGRGRGRGLERSTSVSAYRSRLGVTRPSQSVAVTTRMISRRVKYFGIVSSRYRIGRGRDGDDSAESSRSRPRLRTMVGFDLSISLPPGEKKVEDEICGTFGYVDPEYVKSCFVTEKSDVYSLGVFILLLISGETSVLKDDELTVAYVKRRFENDPLKHILDPKSFEEEGYNEHEIEQHLLPFTNLALRCTEEKGEDRPDMIEVAKQLRQIEKSLHNY